MTDRFNRSDVDIDTLAGCVCCLAHALWIAPVLAATRVKDHRDLFPASVTALAAFTSMPVFDALARGFRRVADLCRANSARNGWLAVVGPETLHAVVFGKRWYPLHGFSI